MQSYAGVCQEGSLADRCLPRKLNIALGYCVIWKACRRSTNKRQSQCLLLENLADRYRQAIGQLRTAIMDVGMIRLRHWG